jgi:hypothetical protein
MRRSVAILALVLLTACSGTVAAPAATRYPTPPPTKPFKDITREDSLGMQPIFRLGLISAAMLPYDLRTCDVAGSDIDAAILMLYLPKPPLTPTTDPPLRIFDLIMAGAGCKLR